MKPSETVEITEPEFRRQFLLGVGIPRFPAGWNRRPLRDGLELVAHPDLPVTHVDGGERALVVLGFVLDPRFPERDDRQVLTDILSCTTTTDEVLAAFDTMGGRWAAIHVAGDGVHVFHDPAGLRGVHYRVGVEGGVWCASHPALLARALGLPEDVETRQRLSDEGVFRPGANYFWPGAGTSFLGVRRLLPNHLLDLDSGTTRRFWPRGPVRPLGSDEAADICVRTLTGVISSAAARFPLALAMTAGFDSRLLLAASREHAARMSYYTFKRPYMTRRTGDLRVPAALLRDHALAHQVIEVPQRSDSDVARAIYSTFPQFHQLKADEATALTMTPPVAAGDWVTVNGNVIEIGRLSENRQLYRGLPVTPQNLARNAGMAGSEVAAREFAAWYDDVREVAADSGINAWDLFYWEHKMGGWLATLRAEFDVVEDGVSPFNSRALIETVLGVEESLRSAPDYPFFRDLIERMWPELLERPINPPGIKARIKERVRSMTTSPRVAVWPARG